MFKFVLMFFLFPSISLSDTVNIHNDTGGSISRYIRTINTLIEQGHSVKITGASCMSSCTLYLGLGGRVCTERGVTFGFHGPSTGVYGLSLPPDGFEYWSNVMASYYPEPLKTWFLDEGRHVTVGFTRVSADTLIELNILNECN